MTKQNKRKDVTPFEFQEDHKRTHTLCRHPQLECTHQRTSTCLQRHHKRRNSKTKPRSCRTSHVYGHPAAQQRQPGKQQHPKRTATSRTKRRLHLPVQPSSNLRRCHLSSTSKHPRLHERRICPRKPMASRKRRQNQALQQQRRIRNLSTQQPNCHSATKRRQGLSFAACQRHNLRTTCLSSRHHQTMSRRPLRQQLTRPRKQKRTSSMASRTNLLARHERISSTGAKATTTA